MKHRDKAFTLIELLVVMAIISILAGLTMAAIGGVRKNAQINAVKTQIKNLAQALTNYQTVYGEFPPTDYALVAGGVASGDNAGIESVVQCLTTSLKGGPFYEFKDVELGNVDADVRTGNPSTSMIVNPQMYEFLDFWGNPLVYIRSTEYALVAAGSYTTYKDNAGRPFTIIPATSGSTGNYQGTYTFQIWSIGPNGINENGQGDDVVSWE